MKNIYKYSLALAFAITVTSCNDQAEINESSITPVKEVHASASIGDGTRVDVTDNGNGLDFVWKDGDYFTVLTSDQTTRFNLVEGAGSRAGEFKGTPSKDYTNQEKLFAVIAGDGMCDVNTRDENGNLRVFIPARQSGLLESKYQLMYSTSRYDEANDLVKFNFHHLVTVFKPNITLPDGVSSVDSISMVMLNGQFAEYATLLVNPMVFNNEPKTEGSLVYSGDSIYLKRYVADHVNVQDNVASSYFYFLPSMFYFSDQYDENGYLDWQAHNAYYSVQPSFLVQSGNNIYVTPEIYGRGVEAGKLYEINTTLEPAQKLHLGHNAPHSYDEICIFMPEADGIYVFNGSYGTLHYHKTNNYGYVLKAGEVVMLRCYDPDNGIVIEKWSSININPFEKTEW